MRSSIRAAVVGVVVVAALAAAGRPIGWALPRPAIGR